MLPKQEENGSYTAGEDNLALYRRNLATWSQRRTKAALKRILIAGIQELQESEHREESPRDIDVHGAREVDFVFVVHGDADEQFGLALCEANVLAQLVASIDEVVRRVAKLVKAKSVPAIISRGK